MNRRFGVQTSTSRKIIGQATRGRGYGGHVGVRARLEAWRRRPWQWGACQGIAVGAGIAVGLTLAGRPLHTILLLSVAAALIVAVGFGVLLSIQSRVHRPPDRAPRE